MVDPDDEILAVTAAGVVIRIPLCDVSERSRHASGVKVMTPDPGDELVAIALVGDDPNADEPDEPDEPGVPGEPDDAGGVAAEDPSGR